MKVGSPPWERPTWYVEHSPLTYVTRVETPLLIVHAIEDDMATLENARFLAARVASTDVQTFLVEDSYHVLTLDRRKYEVAGRVTEFFLGRHVTPDAHRALEAAHANDR